VHFYYDLFTEQFNWRPKFDGLDFYSIDEAASWVETF
jgi:hypothetical protein